MTDEVRAVIYGVGEMGALTTRLLLERGVNIVGAVAKSPHKVGRDLGEIAGLNRPLGVTITADPIEALKERPDIAVVCVGSYLEHMRDHFAVCLENGVNVVTTEEEAIYPWSTAPKVAAELDAIAKANGVSLAASGAQDVFWMHSVSTLLGASHKVETVKGRCSWNVNDFGPDVAKHIHVGQDPESFENHVAQHGWPEFVARQNLEVLIAELGLTTLRVASNVAPIIAKKNTRCESLQLEVKAGQMIGTIDTTTIETEEGPSFTFAMEGYIYGPDDSDTNEWHIKGEPDLHMVNQRANYRFTTCSTMVNRIPDVINAAPGLVTLDQLGAPKYYHGALGPHVK